MVEILREKEGQKKLWPHTAPVGANIGRSKTVTNENALNDYLSTMKCIGAIC